MFKRDRYGLEQAADALDVAPLPPRQRFSRVDVVEAGRSYKQNLTRGERPTDDGYYAFRGANPDLPSLLTVKSHGGIEAIVAEGAHRNWRERAAAWDESHSKEIQSKRKTSRSPRTGPTARTLQHLVFIGEQQPMQGSVLSKHLRVHRMRAYQILRELEEHGYVQKTNPVNKSRYQAYRLTAKGRSEAEEIRRAATESTRPGDGNTGLK